MKRILLLMWVLLLGISMQAQTTITVTSENTLASQLASPSLSTVQSTLIITGTLTVEDFEALNSNTYSQLASVTKLDLSGATVEGFSAMTEMSMNNVEYLNLPSNLTDVTEMKKFGSNNPSLKIVVSCDATNTDIKKSYAYSFTPNSMLGAFSAFGGLEDFRNAKYVTMAGEYGDKDLVGATDGLNFKNSPAIWDFTGAHFVDCTVNLTNGFTYYAYNDQFKENDPITVNSGDYATNAFYYFQSYAGKVVEIKLPDNNMSSLPPRCLSQMAESNKDNYKLVKGVSEDEFNNLFGAATTVKKYYESGTQTEFTGDKFQENGNWKGRVTEQCVVDLSTPTTSSTYTDTWADNKTYDVGNLTVNNGQVTPSEFVAKLNRTVSVKTPGGYDLTNENWKFYQGADGNYYLYDWATSQVGGESITATTPLLVVESYTVSNNNLPFTPTDERPAFQDGQSWYGIIDNPGGVSFNVATTYTYTYNDCDNNPQTLVTNDGNLTQHTADKVTIIDLDEVEVESHGVANYAPVEELVIPNCYELVDYECGKWAHVKNVVVGNGVKIVQGGAFLKCDELENLDFVSGIENCYLGDKAFNECSSMKHIALAEGIVSLGSGCFVNSQHLESIRLPESLKYMGNECLSLCLALNSITIPRNVERIGQNAFYRCPFTDVYLTTTDPDKIPYVWSCGTSFSPFDEKCTFNNGHLNGWGGLPESYQDKSNVQQYDWDRAVEWYYTHCNGTPVLHYPTELAQKVRARISRTYHAKSTDGYGLPMQQDQNKRANVNGADLGTNGQGKYTQDGWAQFMLMKEYIPNGEDVVYSKEYSDVWYTICFPFDLTDEQLAAAFNENFNIVDFGAVEIKDPNTDPSVEQKTMVLHFNRVAVTYYKDVNEKIYKRKLDGDGNVIREQHGTYKYNVYYDPEDPTKEYHHVDASEKLVGNKTKTFALGNNLDEAAANKANAIIIDGILATAGHPYMIHPAVGAAPGKPKKACDLAGITWKPEDQRETIYNREKRSIDLGVSSTSQEREDNYNQEGYSGYGGQTYTFQGNWKRYNSGWETNSEIGPEPMFDMVEPVKRTRPTEAPTQPNFPKPNPEPQPTEYNPVTDLETYPSAFQDLYNKPFDNYFAKVINGIQERYGPNQVNYDATYGDIIQIATYSEYVEDYARKQALKDYLGIYSDPTEEQYNEVKTKVEAFAAAYELYYNYKAVRADWEEWEAYEQAAADYQNWDQSQVDEDYASAMAEYTAAKNTYDTQHAAWEEKMVAYNVLIPKYAYFLGTKKGENYPKYFRQMADESIPRKKGLWTQYTAIIRPNEDAIAGLEAELDGDTQQQMGAKIAYNEDFFVFNDEPIGITTLIEKIEKEEGKAPEVEYMDIVVSIDGKIVSRDKTTFEGLPKGVYIINGKKYYVK